MNEFEDSLKIIFEKYEHTIFKRKSKTSSYLVYIPKYDLKVICSHKISFNNKDIERALTNPKYRYIEKNLYTVELSNKYDSISDFFYTIGDLEKYIQDKLKFCELDLL
jgi:hypothetical protein